MYICNAGVCDGGKKGGFAKAVINGVGGGGISPRPSEEKRYSQATK